MLQHGHQLDTIFSIDIDDGVFDRQLQQQLGASEQLQEPVYQLDTQVGTVIVDVVLLVLLLVLFLCVGIAIVGVQPYAEWHLLRWQNLICR
jgi:hypothetical protein